MTMWTPKLPRNRPKYLGLADAIAADIADGKLAPGMRLPTHRDLADSLGVTVGTVSRGYAEAQRRGLVRGEVGRGTFVLGLPDEPVNPAFFGPGEGNDSEAVHMAHLDGTLGGPTELLERAVARFGRRMTARSMRQYASARANAACREAGARWIRNAGLDRTGPDDVVVTCGAQQGICAAFGALAQPGDVVLTSALTYPGAVAAARFLHLRVAGVDLDEHGMRPDALDQACREYRPKALYIVPTIHHPTATVMPEDRRREIAAVARAHDVTLIEDDVFRFLHPDAPPPVVAFAWPSGVYVTSLSKALLPGLRVGWVRAGGELVDRIAFGVTATTWMPPQGMAELATALIDDGTVDAVVAWKREQVARRQVIARDLLGPWLAPHVSEYGLHLWVELPEPWRASAFVAAARDQGVLVSPPDQFAVGRRHPVPHAVRVWIGGAGDDDSFAGAVRILGDLLRDPRPRAPALI